MEEVLEAGEETNLEARFKEDLEADLGKDWNSSVEGHSGERQVEEITLAFKAYVDGFVILKVPAWKKVWKPKWIEIKVPAWKEIQVIKNFSLAF